MSCSYIREGTLNCLHKYIILLFFLFLHTQSFTQINNFNFQSSDNTTLSNVNESDQLQPVQFSIAGGFYAKPITLELSSPHNDIDIRYTLDGSEPMEESSLYEGPIHIQDRTDEPNNLSTISDISHNYANAAPPAENVFKATVVRAAAFREDASRSPITTNSYFITQQGENRYSLPVISLSAHRDSLFDKEKGIYVLGKIWHDAGGDDHRSGAPANYHQRGEEWERLMHIEFYEPDGTRGISQKIGVRIHGGASRAFPQKSFRLYSRSDYGTSRFSYPIFPEMRLNDFNRLILRNSGQDVAMTMFRDAYIQETVKHMNFATMASRPAIVFINGEYWGIYNIRERYDKHYFETHYGVDREQVDLLTGNRFPKEGSNAHYLELLDYLERNQLRFSRHYDTIDTMMDIENFIDYYIAQIYIRNNDWPHNNIDYWRYQTEYNPGAIIPEQDGRWRWMMFDTDFGFGWQPENWPSYRQNDWNRERHFDRRSYIRNMMEHVSNESSDRAWSTFVFRRLMTNNKFRRQFMNRFADMLNTTFRPERMTAVLDSMKAVYAPEIQEHMNRWYVTEPENWDFYWRPPITYEEWEGEVGVMEEFAKKRPAYQWQHLMNFDDRDTLRIALDVTDTNGGYIQINTIDIKSSTTGVPDNPYPWTGTYFTGIPVSVTAVPRAGYRFAGWEEFPDHDAITISLSPENDTNITAIFEPVQEHDPPAHRLSDGPYVFTYWPSDAAAGTYPDNMVFMSMDRTEPGLNAIAVEKTTGRYDLDSRTRINGLGGDGFAFINTSNLDGNPGYPGRRLGVAVLGLDTRDHGGVEVKWTGGTVRPNCRIYNLRLEYRVGIDGDFKPVPDNEGNPVEYKRNEEAGHSETIGPVRLPDEADDQPYIQLRWRYYFTGERVDDDDGSRSKLRVGDIVVMGSPVTGINNENDTSLPKNFKLKQNYPNPFNNKTVITYKLPETADVTLEIYSLLGRLINRYVGGTQPAGKHSFHINAADWASGVYIARLRVHANSNRQMYLPPIRMILLR